MAADLVAAMQDIPVDGIAVEVTPVLPKAVKVKVLRARREVGRRSTR
jgi:hypothetical protein